MGIPAHSQCPFQSSLVEVLELPDYQKKNWFRAVEAARGRAPMFVDKQREDDAPSLDCKLERIGLR